MPPAWGPTLHLVDIKGAGSGDEILWVPPDLPQWPGQAPWEPPCAQLEVCHCTSEAPVTLRSQTTCPTATNGCLAGDHLLVSVPLWLLLPLRRA